jgi:hypothetical protein
VPAEHAPPTAAVDPVTPSAQAVEPAEDLRPLKARLLDSPVLTEYLKARDAGEVLVEEAPATAPDPAPAAPADPAEDVVARVRAKLAAKAQPETAPPATPPPSSSAPAPADPAAGTYTVEQLRSILDSETALDRLFDLGVDVVKLHERMVARANTPREVRAVNDAVASLRGELDTRVATIERQQQQMLESEERAAFEADLSRATSTVAARAAEFPFLAVESVEEQRERVVRAARELVEAGEDTGTDADLVAIVKIAEDAARAHASRYPGVRLGGASPAVSAGNPGQSARPLEPTTLSGPLGGETSDPEEPPPFRSQEWRQHMLRTASRLGL